MDDGWVIVEGRPVPVVVGPRYRVTVNSRGEIYFNEAVWAAIGRPANVTLLFDPAGRRLAIKFPVPADRHFHRVRRCGRNKKTLIVRAARMLKQFNMTVPCKPPLFSASLNWSFRVDSEMSA
jgi:hypothetical protein